MSESFAEKASPALYEIEGSSYSSLRPSHIPLVWLASGEDFRACRTLPFGSGAVVEFVPMLQFHFLGCLWTVGAVDGSADPDPNISAAGCCFYARRLILINAHLHPERLRSVLAHEMGHMLMHKAAFALDGTCELAADMSREVFLVLMEIGRLTPEPLDWSSVFPREE